MALCGGVSRHNSCGLRTRKVAYTSLLLWLAGTGLTTEKRECSGGGLSSVPDWLLPCELSTVHTSKQL